MNLLKIFELIDKENHDLFIQEVINQDRDILQIESVGEMINLSLTWDETSQGDDFWCDLCNEYALITTSNYASFIAQYYI